MTAQKSEDCSLLHSVGRETTRPGDRAYDLINEVVSATAVVLNYWPQLSVKEEVKRMLHNLGRFSCPLTLLSQYFPIEYEAIRQSALENDAAAIIGHHIPRVLRFYGVACGAPAS
jgi:tagatose-1,6-bisphosphate aldolase non-catalytic subunit AgaZ/GatZ